MLMFATKLRSFMVIFSTITVFPIPKCQMDTISSLYIQN